MISFVERLSHFHHRHKRVTPSTRLFVFCCACCCTKVTPSQLRALFGSITSALRTETGQDVIVACVIFAHSLFCSPKRLTGKFHTSRRREDSSAWRATEQMVEKNEKKPGMENPVAEAPQGASRQASRATGRMSQGPEGIRQSLLQLRSLWSGCTDSYLAYLFLFFLHIKNYISNS